MTQDNGMDAGNMGAEYWRARAETAEVRRIEAERDRDYARALLAAARRVVAAERRYEEDPDSARLELLDALEALLCLRREEHGQKCPQTNGKGSNSEAGR